MLRLAGTLTQGYKAGSRSYTAACIGDRKQASSSKLPAVTERVIRADNGTVNLSVEGNVQRTLCSEWHGYGRLCVKIQWCAVSNKTTPFSHRFTGKQSLRVLCFRFSPFRALHENGSDIQAATEVNSQIYTCLDYSLQPQNIVMLRTDKGNKVLLYSVSTTLAYNHDSSCWYCFSVLEQGL